MPRLLLPTLMTSVLLLGLGSPAAGEGGSDAGTADAGQGTDAGEQVVAHVADAGMPGLVPPRPVPDRLTSPPIANLEPLPGAKDVLGKAKRGKDGRLYAVHGSGAALPLTILPDLQDQLKEILERYETPMAAIVVLDPSTGRVLAMTEHSEERPKLRGLATRAVYPAASIFKIVTASALLRAGVRGDSVECYSGGLRRLTPRMLEDDRGGHCITLAQAMGRSTNVVFAKMTRDHLSVDALREEAARFRFNRPLSFPLPTEVSLASIPEDPFAFAETGAGFGDVYLSPLHGALIASVAANGGLWRAPVLLEDAAQPEPERVLTEEQAAALTEMLEETVVAGTARRIFRERGYRVEGAVGKTGTLADRKPFRDYSWFVGFAPKENPRVAVAAVIVNDPRWRIRATWLGREAMRLALKNLPELPEPSVLVAEGESGAAKATHVAAADGVEAVGETEDEAATGSAQEPVELELEEIEADVEADLEAVR